MPNDDRPPGRPFHDGFAGSAGRSQRARVPHAARDDRHRAVGQPYGRDHRAVGPVHVLRSLSVQAVVRPRRTSSDRRHLGRRPDVCTMAVERHGQEIQPSFRGRVRIRSTGWKQRALSLGPGPRHRERRLRLTAIGPAALPLGLWTLPLSAPTGFGLYDMVGNVSSWTQDCFHDTYQDAPETALPWTSGPCRGRVIRGGSWQSRGVLTLRSAFRDWVPTSVHNSSIGFPDRAPDSALTEGSSVGGETDQVVAVAAAIAFRRTAADRPASPWQRRRAASAGNRLMI